MTTLNKNIENWTDEELADELSVITGNPDFEARFRWLVAHALARLLRREDREENG